jgi:hypothetical protein
MTRGTAIVLLLSAGSVCFFAVAGSASRSSAAGPAPAAAPGPAAAESPSTSPSVRIEHELIEVPVVKSPQPPAPVASPIRDRVRRARLTDSGSSRPSFALNARRILLGDGRDRPSPVPRP